MRLGFQVWLALGATTLLATGCGSGDSSDEAQCLLSVEEAATATGLAVADAEPWDQEASGDGPACLYTAEDGGRLNLLWRTATDAEIEETLLVQSENSGFFKTRNDLASGAFVGANGIPSVFVPAPTGHLVVVQMLDGVDIEGAASSLAIAAAETCCPEGGTSGGAG